MSSHRLESMVLNSNNPIASNNDQVAINVEQTKKDDFADIKIYDTIEEFNQNLPETVTLLKMPNNVTIYLVGTAHFSEKSQEDVANVIRNVKPKSVVVELCESRVHILKFDEQKLLEEAKDVNMQKIRSVIRTNGVINGMFYILLLNMSAKLTKELGMAPGGEFRTALKEASKIQGCKVHLGDRPINITLQRAIKSLTLWQTLKLVRKLMTIDENITKEEVEQCKQKDLLEELMKEMAGEFPKFGEVFVNERDLYLCYSLQLASLHSKYQLQQSNRPLEPFNVVGVMGIGHCAGVTKYWNSRTAIAEEIPKIMTIPKASTSTRIFGATVKYGTFALVGYGIYRLTAPYIRRIF